MTTRTDLNQLLKLSEGLEDSAAARLRSALAALSPGDPGYDAAVEGLVEAVQRFYGPAAVETSVDWYASLRPAGEPPMPRPGLVAHPAPIPGAPRIAASGGSAVLEDALRRWLRAQSRGAVSQCLDRDPSDVRYARVPRGPRTCAFCIMLAGRGWVYRSGESALERARHERYHACCDCTIAPAWGPRAPRIAGYDPDRLHAVYTAARDEAAGADESSVLAAMRRLGLDECADSIRT